MNIYLVSIFPSIFDSFLETSLIKKAIDKKLIKIDVLDPRSFVPGKGQYVDDEIYGGGAGMLMKAKPVIDAVEDIVKRIMVNGKRKKSVTRSTLPVSPKSFRIIYLSPSKEIFTQKKAHSLSEVQHIIFVCGRYEGIDHRFVEYMEDKYPKNFETLSLGKFITLGGEAPAMTVIESIVRLVPGVIKDAKSRQDESYSLQYDMKNIEYPQYTRPEEVFGYKVPEILLGGHHKNIEERRKKKIKRIR